MPRTEIEAWVTETAKGQPIEIITPTLKRLMDLGFRPCEWIFKG
jgi:hypothetical protein